MTLARISSLAALLATGSTVCGTSIVVLANKTQIAVAADSAQQGNRGEHSTDACKIFRFRKFYFVMAGAVVRDENQKIAEAAQGTNNLLEIQKRFNQTGRQSVEDLVNYRLEHVPNYRKELRSNTQAFQIIFFEMTAKGPLLAESLFSFQILGTGKVRVGQPQTRLCKYGDGECSLGIGENEEAKKYISDHPLKGQDLIADAEKLVRIEAEAQPKAVGGNINMLLLDGSGEHPINMSPGCPLIVTATVSH
jgi:hypothetical protein